MANSYEEILSLRAIRSYRDEPLADDDLGAILEAARWTGSSTNRQNWSLVVVRDPAQRERLAACGDFTDPIRNAPVTLALIQEPVGYEFDTGRLAQNVMLAADAIGVASCPITLHREDDAHRVLGLPPEARCRYAIALGYPSDEAAPARFGGRKPLSEIAFEDRYGQSR
jgi:nitroreductase